MNPEDICCVTYTTSKYADVWPAYFGQFEKHSRGLKNYVLSDRGSGENFDFGDSVLIEHDDDAPYWEQYTDALGTIEEPFVVYHQEDFFLYSDVDTTALQRYCRFLLDTSYSYVRMIRCGYRTPLDAPLIDSHAAATDLYAVNMLTNDAFSMQATLWKRSSMLSLYEYVKSSKWLEGDHWNRGCRDLNIRGAFCYNGERQRGKFHYDSIVWPYTCTAVNRGKWNLTEYPEIMSDILSMYDIDPHVRGVRTW